MQFETSWAASHHLKLCILATFILSLTLTSCGSSPKQSVSTPISSTSALSLLKTFNAEAATDVAGKFHVQMSGIRYFNDFDSPQPQIVTQLPGGIYCGSMLVLAQPTLSYSDEQVQEMRSDVKEEFSDSINVFTFDPPGPPSNATNVPSELEWVQGLPGGNCAGEMEVTNIGDTPIEIEDVGVDLNQAPVINDYSYRLIEKCSLLGGSAPAGGSGGPDCVFYADFQLGAGNRGITYQAPLLSNQSSLTHAGFDFICPTPIIVEPGHVVDVMLRFALDPQIATGMIYRVIPFLSLRSSSGASKITLPKLTSVLAFAKPDQFSCYDLSGNTFILDTTIKLANTFGDFDDSTGKGKLCV